MDEFGLEQLDFVKFNIEGMEFEVFDGFSRRNEVGAYLGYSPLELSDGQVERFLEHFEDYILRTAPSKKDRIKFFAQRRNGS